MVNNIYPADGLKGEFRAEAREVFEGVAVFLPP